MGGKHEGQVQWIPAVPSVSKLPWNWSQPKLVALNVNPHSVQTPPHNVSHAVSKAGVLGSGVIYGNSNKSTPEQVQVWSMFVSVLTCVQVPPPKKSASHKVWQVWSNWPLPVPVHNLSSTHAPVRKIFELLIYLLLLSRNWKFLYVMLCLIICFELTGVNHGNITTNNKFQVGMNDGEH